MSTNSGHIGKYELQERLGQGSVAEVWKAYDTESHRYVAIKLFYINLRTDPDFLTRFQHQAPVIASLRHPNIVRYYDFSISQLPGIAGTSAYMVMDYIEGGTLTDYIRKTSRAGKFLPIADIVRLFSSIGMAVNYAHSQGMIHGNIKTANILLDKPNSEQNTIGEPIVTDFGIAKLLAATVGGTSGSLIATPLYISPEQVMGSPANEKSDIYSLGIMLYEICTGTLPFQAGSPAAIMMQHVNTVPASPALINPNLPSAVSTVIMRSIAKDPSARFPSAASLVVALTEAAGQGEKTTFNTAVSGNVGVSASPTNSINMPTISNTIASQPPIGVIPSPASSSPGVSASSLSPSPLISGSGGQTPSHSYTPPYHDLESSSPVLSKRTMPESASSQSYSVTQSAGPTTPTTSPSKVEYSPPNLPVGPPLQRKPGRRGIFIILAVLLILILLASSLAAYFAFFSRGPVAATPTIVGQAYFISSGLLNPNPNSRQGITDQLQMNLQNIPAPQPGETYYAWLLNDKHMPWNPVPLGALTVNHGTATLFYPGDAQHTNLLATNSRFLITEEAAQAPASPSLDPSTWRYYAGFSQVPNPADPQHFSLYDHIRHLLADDPKVKAAGLTGGLDIWLYKNTEKLLEWSGSARFLWNQKEAGSALLHRQLLRIMDYLDGTTYVQKDLPGVPLFADPTVSKVPLLTFDPQTQNPPGYLYHIGKHLHELTQLSQSSQQIALAIQIGSGINGVNLWLENMRTDVLNLYHMPDAQLFGNDGLALLNDVVTLANYAFAGKVDTHDQVTDGVIQIHYAIQRLATFNVRACTTANPCAL